MAATTKHLKTNKCGVSNVIVVMLSLVLIVIIVSNVVLWSYQMNEVDWERNQEKISLVNVERTSSSPWFTSHNEYTINTGSRQSGTYSDTWTADGNYEAFLEEPMSTDGQELDISCDFALDLATFPIEHVRSIDIQIRYRANDSLENWFFEAYNWTKGEYGIVGFNATFGDMPASEFNYYEVSIISDWPSYVQNGTIKIAFSDSHHGDGSRTGIDIDVFAVRVVVSRARFSFANEGSIVSRIVGIWITNSTLHRRYDADFFIDSGANADYVAQGMDLPSGSFAVRAITDKGNIAVFAKS